MWCWSASLSNSKSQSVESKTGLAPWVPTTFSFLPLILVLLVNICHLFKYAVRAPAWTKPFVQEPINKKDVEAKSKSRLSYATICLCITCFAGLVAQLCMALRLSWAIMPTVAWALALMNLIVKRPRTAPIMMVFFFISMFTAQIVIIAARSDRNILHPVNITGLISGLMAFFAGILASRMPLRDPSLSSNDISEPFTSPTSDLRSPEDNVTLWQWMSVSWMSPLISLGSQKQLNDADIWFLGYEFQHRHLHHAFRDLRGTVIRRLIRANWFDLVILSVLALLELVGTFAQPLLLQQLLLAMEITNVTLQPAITFGLLNLAASFVVTQSGIFSLWFGRRCYERSRGELIMMLYEKTLARKIVSGVQQEETKREEATVVVPHLTEGVESVMVQNETEPTEATPLLKVNRSGQIETPSRKAVKKVKHLFKKIFKSKEPEPDTKMPASMGKIINMFRNDAYEVAQRFWDCQQLIKKPIGLILALALSWQIVGWSITIGLVIVVVAQILNAVLMKLIVSWGKKRRKVTDDRLQKTSQFVEAIRHLRWYGWQSTWLVGIMESRQRELNMRVITSFLNMGINITSIVASGMLPVATFYAYTELAGHQLRIDIAFPALALFDMLQRELRDLPQLVTTWLNAMIAVGRIEEFMGEPDRNGDENVQISKGDSLELNEASFAWPGTTGDVLHDVSIKFLPGLNVVFGKVGAGKTALLQGLLEELNLTGGELVKPDKPIGYCAQTPWLQSMSIRDNILFSAPYDPARYKMTIDVCALIPDFNNFKDGDLSEIGENGIGLSGGQKARIALARAVYSRTEVLLLDDPLSALDQQTAEWVAAKCLGGELLSGRTTVLVTHRTDLCTGLAKQMIEITNGSAQISDEEVAVLTAIKSRETQPDESAIQAEKAQESAEAPDKFIEEERRATGGIEWTVYWQFIKAGGAWTWIVLLIVDIIFHGLVFVRNWFLKEWGEAYDGPQELTFLLFPTFSNITYANTTTKANSTLLSRIFEHFPDPAADPKPWLIGLTVIVLVQSAAWLSDQLVMVVLIYTTGRKMFRLIMDRVSNAIFRFYDVTPVGRLMNRMTSDIGAIDGSISGTLSNVIFWGASWVISVFVIAGTTPVFLVASVFLTVAFVLVFLRFLPTSQSLRRLETVSLSPLMSNFGALLEGLTTVRAFCAQSRFQDSAIASTDTFQKMDHFYWSLQAWLQYRFEVLSAASTFAMTLLAIFSGVSPGLTAFVLRAAGKFVQTTHALCKEYGRLQMDFVSVERVVELFHIEQEPKGTIQPPAWWPSCSSDVVFEDVVIRYASHLEPALRGVSFTLRGGSNTAVIGRTGSGKSTLALALLGTLVPDSGRILIGGIDVTQVDKQTLRTRISFLAQDPVLFPGSLRQNLDPTNQHTDEDCESVLQRVCGRFGWTLQMVIDAGGKNLSQGQRQLVGLCRAILRRSAVIIMDEATASIDKESAWEIQRVLREELKESTVITIAHRTEAVRGADYCLNLGKGKIIEQGKPSEIVGGARGEM